MRTLLLIALLLMPVTAQATPLTFEVGGSSLSMLNEVTPHYGGVDWRNTVALLDQSHYAADWGSTLAFPSGEQVAFNGYGIPMTLEGDMTVAGAWFAPWTADDQWYDGYSAHSVTIEGWYEGVLIGSDTLNLDPTAFRYLATDFGPVDWLRIRADDGAQARWFLMDDLDVTRISVVHAIAVPESPTWLLLFGGLAVIGWKWFRLSTERI